MNVFMVYLLIIFLIIALDQYTKKIVCDNLELEEKREIKNTNIMFWHKKNTGISYSSFSAYPKQITIITGVIATISFFIFMFLLPIKGIKIIKTGFAFMIGGSIGNLIDRFRNNCVTDFIYIKCKHTPIFNLADVFVVLGGTIMFISSICKKN
ncbi:MAG TPA: signal peptidase II [Lachnospiraceae bacterium]|nr:signal peptidase II [Lachnospiraceae bacterium]